MNKDVLATMLMVGDRVNVRDCMGNVIATTLSIGLLRDLVASESGEIGIDSPSWKCFDPAPMTEASLLEDGFKALTAGETFVKDLRFLRVFVDLVDERLVILERKCNVREEERFEEIIEVPARYWHDLQHALRLSKLA